MKPKADKISHRIAWADIDLAPIRTLIQLAKDEDLNGGGLAQAPTVTGDVSSQLLDPSETLTAQLRARQEIAVCGLHLAPEILAAYSRELEFAPNLVDGAIAQPGDTLGTLSGPVQAALSAERPLLNFLQKLSGVATETRRYAQTLAGSHTRLLDTRKTTPGYRVLEKYAVVCGGGYNHRMGLFDRVMLKDNHIAAFGEDPLSGAIAACEESRRRHPKHLIEIEVDAFEQIDIALAAQADIILLDNFSINDLATAVSKIGDQAATEASGGITLESLKDIAATGVDFISTGATIHQSTWIDIGLDWE